MDGGNVVTTQPEPWATHPLHPIDVAHAALLEAGRPDLAEWIHGWEDEDGFYLEYDDDILDESDWAVIDKAETLARQSIGLGPRIREIPLPIFLGVAQRGRLDPRATWRSIGPSTWKSRQ